MKTYTIIFEELSIDEQGYYLVTCKGTKFRLVKCKPICEVSKNG